MRVWHPHHPPRPPERVSHLTLSRHLVLLATLRSGALLLEPQCRFLSGPFTTIRGEVRWQPRSLSSGAPGCSAVPPEQEEGLQHPGFMLSTQHLQGPAGLLKPKHKLTLWPHPQQGGQSVDLPARIRGQWDVSTSVRWTFLLPLGGLGVRRRKNVCHLKEGRSIQSWTLFIRLCQTR